jgi:hypothetical protein
MFGVFAPFLCVFVKLLLSFNQFVLRGMNDIPLAVGGLHRDFPTPCLLREQSVTHCSQRGHEATHLDNVICFETAEFAA